MTHRRGPLNHAGFVGGSVKFFLIVRSSSQNLKLCFLKDTINITKRNQRDQDGSHRFRPPNLHEDLLRLVPGNAQTTPVTSSGDHQLSPPRGRVWRSGHVPACEKVWVTPDCTSGNYNSLRALRRLRGAGRHATAAHHSFSRGLDELWRLGALDRRIFK